VTTVPLSLCVVVDGGREAVILHHSAIEGVGGLDETRPCRNDPRHTRTQVTAFSNSSFIHSANVLTVTEVTVTTTIYGTDDTAMLNSGRRLRDRNLRY